MARESLGIADLAGQEITWLSGGQRQMMLIARALAVGAQSVVMDEPTASLDFTNRIRVGQAIRALAGRGTAVILSTHAPDQAAARALLVGRSRVLASGPIRAATTAERPSDLCDVPLQREDLPDGAVHFRS